MEQFWRKKTFKVLLTTWNKKLEQSGFNDAEIELRSDRALKQSASSRFKRWPEWERESRLEYYCFLGNLVNNTVFKNELEKFIMIMHSEGATIREIVDQASLNGISVFRKTVMHIIRRWETKWGIRSWSLQQMNLKRDID
jgi:hypothetical protein